MVLMRKLVRILFSTQYKTINHFGNDLFRIEMSKFKERRNKMR